MPITQLNHAVLYVRSADRTARFYEEVLGFRRIPLGFPNAIFLQAPGSTNDHDIGIFGIGDEAGDSQAGRQTVGLYHLAWEVETLQDLADLAEALTARGALAGASDHGTTKSLYARDPDGLEFEIAWIVPADKIDAAAEEGRKRIERLDLPAEMQRYGATTRGGVGISTHA